MLKNDIFAVVMEQVKHAAKKINNWLIDCFSRFQNKKITVETEVKGAEKVEEVKHAVETLPKTKPVEVKVDKKGGPSSLDLSGKETGETIPVKPGVSGLPDPPVSKWSKLQGVFKSLRGGIKNFLGGLKNVTDYLLSSGGGVLILIEGFKSLVKIVTHFYNNWIEGMKDAAQVSERNAESIREAAQANEELRQGRDARTATERTEETRTK